MATLTTNLFRGNGPGTHRLDVIEGTWPSDIAGTVFIIGPDKRSPGGHWFDAPGLLMRIDPKPGRDGRILVRQRRLRTRLVRWRERLPWLFATVAFTEVSPFGVTNMANTNVDVIEDRLFIGYDAGRPVEVDPDTLEVIGPVGGTGEWFQAMPGLVEPMIAVAAHPAADHDEGVLWFVNSSPVPGPDGPNAQIARWDLYGEIERWPVAGLAPFESIHDIKATRNHLVFCDLPFYVGPESVGFGERTAPNADVTQLVVVAKADLDATPPGRPVPSRTFTIPMQTGHLSVDEDDGDGTLTVYLEHIPLADLMIKLNAGEVTRGGGTVGADYEGLVALAVQPGVVGRYRIDTATGELTDSQLAWDDTFWGPVLATRDRSSAAARCDGRYLWYSGVGFDPELVSAEWWRLYGDADLHCVVHPKDLPTSAVPGSIVRFDLQTMTIDQRWSFADGAFASPPQFVPRAGSGRPDDGYVLVLVHCDGTKELQVFDAANLGDGPLARATTSGFCPPLLLHSTWAPTNDGRRIRRPTPVGLAADVWGSIREIPRHLVTMVRTAMVMARQRR